MNASEIASAIYNEIYRIANDRQQAQEGTASWTLNPSPGDTFTPEFIFTVSKQDIKNVGMRQVLRGQLILEIVNCLQGNYGVKSIFNLDTNYINPLAFQVVVNFTPTPVYGFGELIDD